MSRRKRLAATPIPATRRRGRPRKWTGANIRRILRCIERGTPFAHSCSALGVSVASFCSRRNRYPEFERAIQCAVAKGITARLAKIERASATDWRAAAWLLEHCQPQHFAVSRQLLEVSGPGGAPLAGVVAVVLPQKMDSHGGQLPAVTVPALTERSTDGNGA